MSPLALSLSAFGCVIGGVLLGTWAHSHLPDGHKNSDTKEVVRLGMALVGTTVALVLGLLIASSKGFYDTQSTEVTEVAANVVLLDRILAHYGPETKDVRAVLRGSVADLVGEAAPQNDWYETRFDPGAFRGEVLFEKLEELTPQNDRQRALQAQALQLAMKLGQTRWLMYAQKASSVPMPLLAILVFWLTLLFLSFALFVRPNAMIMSSLVIFGDGGLRSDLPDPRNVPAIFRVDSRV
jgi:hypothetical protein